MSQVMITLGCWFNVRLMTIYLTLSRLMFVADQLQILHPLINKKLHVICNGLAFPLSYRSILKRFKSFSLVLNTNCCSSQPCFLNWIIKQLRHVYFFLTMSVRFVYNKLKRNNKTFILSLSSFPCASNAYFSPEHISELAIHSY